MNLFLFANHICCPQRTKCVYLFCTLRVRITKNMRKIHNEIHIALKQRNGGKYEIISLKIKSYLSFLHSFYIFRNGLRL